MPESIPHVSANTIVKQFMYDNDAFSQWMGIEVLEVSPGFCHLQARIRQDMLNGFGICHGGVLFSLADSALAFASNAHGKHALSIETSVSLFRSAKEGDVVQAKTIELHKSRHIARYQIELSTEQHALGVFQGTVYIRDQSWEVNPSSENG
ncbi:MAG: hotdog fold thioesterase [Saprospiraceae bacterium]|jgi:acyl-CoA thioesterase|nr:hotdog fold thioesterase [Saprospiraceae bacterium]